MNNNDKRIYLAGARALACITITTIAAAGVGAALVHGVSDLRPFEARRAMEPSSMGSIHEGNAVQAQTPAAAIEGVEATDGREPQASAPNVPAAKQPRRSSDRHPATPRPAPRELVSQADFLGSEGNCRLHELRMGPVDRWVRYCEF